MNIFTYFCETAKGILNKNQTYHDDPAAYYQINNNKISEAFTRDLSKDLIRMVTTETDLTNEEKETLSRLAIALKKPDPDKEDLNTIIDACPTVIMHYHIMTQGHGHEKMMFRNKIDLLRKDAINKLKENFGIEYQEEVGHYDPTPS